jgi:hypothetical protein
VRLAMGVTDQRASAALWAYAEELLEKATALEASGLSLRSSRSFPSRPESALCTVCAYLK